MEESGSDSEEEVVMYRCRHCPGQEFTADERDGHRQAHVEMRLLKLKQTLVRQQVGKIKDIKCWGMPIGDSCMISSSIVRMLPNLEDLPGTSADFYPQSRKKLTKKRKKTKST